MGALRIPGATYRFQFNRGFRLADARALVPYLHKLGITDLYASPIFKARWGSLHGYDVIDPTQMNPELGSEKDFQALRQTLKRHNMGLLLDLVPNHMAASSENPYWLDVLEHGQCSHYASTFDIDWGQDPNLSNTKVILPVLGDSLSRVLERREISLTFNSQGLWFSYYDNRFPLDPKTYEYLLAYGLASWRKALGEQHRAVRDVMKLVEAMRRLPDRTESNPTKASERARGTKRVKARLWELYQTTPEVTELIDRNLKICNGTRGYAKNLTLLGQLVARQAYQLEYWRSGAGKINYRRFFDLNDLAAVRVELPEVFEKTHELIRRWVRKGAVTGLRIDHVDGLRDPLEYLVRLQKLAARGQRSKSGFFIVVEKILSEGEPLPEEWPVFGTTGYDFLNSVNRVFVDGEGLNQLSRVYERFTGMQSGFDDVVYQQKKKVIEGLFKAEFDRLGASLNTLITRDPSAPPFALYELTQALVEATACLAVYRTYIRTPVVSTQDRNCLVVALREARRRNLALGASVFDCLENILLPENRSRSTDSDVLRFVMKWQQLSGPVMAKGFEDTSLYIYNRLISLNDVGGNPSPVKLDLEDFHACCEERSQNWPHSMNATSTHDTKRGEDHRARLNVISEFSTQWQRHVRQWSRWNAPKKRRVSGIRTPDANEEYFLYQTLLGAWPFSKREVPAFKRRVKAYMVKAAREAKVHTSWLNVDEAHESALLSFIDAILENDPGNKFLNDFLEFQQEISFYGAINSLGQLLLKTMAPGVPDFFQGTELWDLSLVDPDNRRPVDFPARRKLLEQLSIGKRGGLAGSTTRLLNGWRNGGVKLHLISRALEFRRAHHGLFLRGNYLPMQASGKRKDHICAFARCEKSQWCVVVVPRLCTQLVPEGKFPLGPKVWGRSLLHLPQGAPDGWRNVMTGESLVANSEGGLKVIALHEVFSRFPVALLSAPGDG